MPGSALDTPSPRRPGIASAASRRAGRSTVVLLAPACVLVLALATRRLGGLANPAAVPLAALVVVLLELALMPFANAI
ncbi:MAG TPA: hypothetical protein VLI21_06725, partial [Casimicrobiaceae bacterium]|nr:hypothetical protein [Casimicrobiaceae bacterium]